MLVFACVFDICEAFVSAPDWRQGCCLHNGVVVASGRKTARRIAAGIRTNEFTVSDACTAGGVRRSVETQKNGGIKGMVRSKRVGPTTRRIAKGQKIVLAGVKPVSGYENVVRGTAPSHNDELRKIWLRNGMVREDGQLKLKGWIVQNTYY